MTDSTRFIGPRGWAVLVLASGAALSSPFLRNSGSAPNAANPTAGAQPKVDFSNSSWPDLREKNLTPTGQVATNLTEQDWAELAQLQSHSGATPRKLTGELPSTSPITSSSTSSNTGTSRLPSWADRGPRIDQLVNDSIRTEPLAPAAPVSTNKLDPLRPWMGHGMKPIAETQPAPIQASSLPNDFALATPNPDARWSQGPTAQGSGTLDSNSLAGNSSFRKFEDHVTQWPDEKLAPSQFALDSTRQPDRPSDPLPQSSRPSEFAANQSMGAYAATPSMVSPFTRPETVSAPMVSSQSGRPAQMPVNPPTTSPVDNVPKIDANKPSPGSQRPKHFIQQPSKRA